MVNDRVFWVEIEKRLRFERLVSEVSSLGGGLNRSEFILN